MRLGLDDALPDRQSWNRIRRGHDSMRHRSRNVPSSTSSSAMASPHQGPRLTVSSIWKPRRHSRSTFTPTAFLCVLLLCLALATPARAVKVAFSNCLPESRINRKPGEAAKPLQWTPLLAEASYSTKDKQNALLVQVWGNVSGQALEGVLPKPDSSDWTSDSFTNGKIVEHPDDKYFKVTTLFRKLNVLTYSPWSEAVNFCQSGLTNGSCPLAPVFDKSLDPHDLPSINMAHDFDTSYSFASFETTLFIINGDRANTTLGCVSAVITPDLGSLSHLVRLLPLAILLFCGLAVLLAATLSPWGSLDIFQSTSNYGRDADLLRLITPGFGDCLQYIQFIVLTGGLNLDYPGYFQPVVSQLSWSTLMFNQSLVSNSPSWHSVVDGIYVTDGKYGMQRLGQLAGMAKGQDIWAGMMVWLCVIIAGTLVLIQAGFLIQRIIRHLNKTPEEDLRAKNIPFSLGNVVRIIFIFMLLPLVSLSTFQFVIYPGSPKYVMALSVIVFLLLIGATCWILAIVVRTRPKSVLFDDLPTVLLYGPMYNTYSDGQASFALITVLLTFLRGIAIGAVQPSGVAQVVLLAICEVIYVLTLQAIRPFHRATSMNIYHSIFSVLRLAIILLMIAFAGSLGVTEGPKGWIGYAILLIHTCILIFGFFLSALQTIVEVVARMMGAGGNREGGQTRGGLTKIFGMRELSKREVHRQGPSRTSQLSTSAMLDMEDGSKSGYVMPSGRVRSGSAASLSAIAAHHRQRSSSVLDSIDAFSGAHRHAESGSSYMPGTPGDASTFSFVPSPMVGRPGVNPLSLEASDPYYRPPRRRTDTLTDPVLADLQRGPLGIDPRHIIPSSGNGTPGEAPDLDADISRGATPGPGPTSANIPAGGIIGGIPPNRPDYSTREVDFYYGVRGPALNSDGLGRKLGTGPADPTGPVSVASGWFRNILGGKTKEKGKGFEVVRSSRMPPAMVRRGGAFGDETPPEGIAVATGVPRTGPIDSDDEDEPRPKQSPARPEKDLLAIAKDGDAEVSDPDESDGEADHDLMRPKPTHHDVSDDDDDEDGLPGIPRKSSKRHSKSMTYLQLHLPSLSLVESEEESPANHPVPEASSAKGHSHNLSVSSQLPFERTGSQKRLSSKSSMDFPGEFTQVDLHGDDGRPASFGVVPHHEINRVDPHPRQDSMAGSHVEWVDESTVGKRT